MVRFAGDSTLIHIMFIVGLWNMQINFDIGKGISGLTIKSLIKKKIKGLVVESQSILNSNGN